MEVSCDFIGKQLICMLPNQMMDVLLKVHMKTGKHTLREDVYTCSLKYTMWNNQLRPFRSLQKRVTNIFRKSTSNSNDRRGTSSQSIVNYMERDSEERSVINESKRNSVHSDWSDLIPIDVEAKYHRIHNIEKHLINYVHLLCHLLLLLQLFQFHSLLQLECIKQLKHCFSSVYSKA